MIGYKKCIYLDVDPAGTKIKEALVTLEIPDDAKVVMPVNPYGLVFARISKPLRKLRCKAAKVLDIVDVETKDPVLCAFSAYSMVVHFVHRAYFIPEAREPKTICTICTYIKGEMVVADGLDENELEECGNGIHFFLTEEEALRYRL